MGEATVVNKGDDLVDLPPGFRFHPTDEEIISSYLTEKVKNCNFHACAIGEADLNKCEPWDLPKKAKMGEKEWYFFFQRDRKYPTGMRTNRATEAGYWKATGKDKEIFKGKKCLVGMKKTLVFYKGRAPKGEKSNWVMHEYRHEGKFSYYSLPRGSKDEWVVCRVFHKSTGLKKTSIHDLLDSNSYLPPLMQPPYNSIPGSSSFNNEGDSDHQFKPMTLSRSSDANYLPQFSTNTMTNQNQDFLHHQPQSTGFQTPTSYYYDQMQASNPVYNFQTPPNMGYIPGFQGTGFDVNGTLLRELASNNEASRELEKQCKVEQFSSNSKSMVSLSQDTGISTDMNTTAEISSKQEIASENNKLLYEGLEGPSIGGIGDLDQLWDY